jgi:hypothetical protein
VGTSWDILPLDRITAMLSEKLGDWKRDAVEEVTIPSALWGRVSAYHRAVAVRYTHSRDERREVTLWLLPNKFDERAVETLKSSAKDAEPARPPATLVVYLGENYRVLLMSPARSDRSLAPLLKDLAAVFGKNPEMTVPEWPLPEAAPDGRILEPA